MEKRNRMRCFLCGDEFENKTGWDGDELINHLNEEHTGEIIDLWTDEHWNEFVIEEEE